MDLGLARSILTEFKTILRTLTSSSLQAPLKELLELDKEEQDRLNATREGAQDSSARSATWHLRQHLSSSGVDDAVVELVQMGDAGKQLIAFVCGMHIPRSEFIQWLLGEPCGMQTQWLAFQRQ